MKTDRQALEEAIAALRFAKLGSGAIVRSCCATCARAEIPESVTAAGTWFALFEMDGTQNEETFRPDGYLARTHELLAWSGNQFAIADTLRKVGFTVQFPRCEHEPLGVNTFRPGAMEEALDELFRKPNALENALRAWFEEHGFCADEPGHEWAKCWPQIRDHLDKALLGDAAEEGAHARVPIERVLNLIDEHLAAYPETIFLPDSKTPDGIAADAIRWKLSQLRAELLGQKAPT